MVAKKYNEIKNGVWGFDKALYYMFIFLAPLFFLPTTLFPVAANKQLLVGMLFFVLLIYVLVRFLLKGKAEFPVFWSLLAAVGLFLAVLVSALFSQVKSVSFLGYSADSLFWAAMYVLAFLLGVVTLRDKKSIIISAAVFAVSMGILTAFVFLQFAGVLLLPFDFAQASEFNPVGTISAVGFVVAGAFAALLSFLTTVKIQSNKLRITLWITLGLFAIFILQFNLWSIWLSLALTFVVMSIVIGYSAFSGQKTKSFRPIFAPFLVILIGLIGASIQIAVPSFMNVPVEIGLTHNTTFDIAKNSLSGARFVYGTGPGTFQYNYSLHRPSDIIQTDFWAVRFEQGFSAFLTYLSTWGILGTLALLAAFSVFYKTLSFGALAGVHQHAGSLLHSIVAGALGASLFWGISTFISGGNSVLYLLLFASAGIGIAALRELGVVKIYSLNLLKSPTLIFSSAAAAILVAVFAVGGGYSLVKNYMAQVHAASAIKTFAETGNIDTALFSLGKALQLDPNNDVLLRLTSEAFITKATEIIADTSLEPEEMSQQFNDAFENAARSAELAVASNPADTQNYIQLGEVYISIVGIVDGAENLAVDAYERAKAFDPRNPSLSLSQARVYIVLSDVLQTELERASALDQEQIVARRIEALKKAEEKISDALKLKPNFADARFLLVVMHRRLGDLDEALAQTQKIAAANPNNFDILFQVGLIYHELEKFEEARSSLERALNLAGGVFGNARYYLGLTYAELGNIATAITHFEALVQDNPDNELVRGILENLRAGRPPLDGLQEPQTAPPLPTAEGADEQLQ
jgi:tetratricopeptide (TPR) repeat protein